MPSLAQLKAMGQRGPMNHNNCPPGYRLLLQTDATEDEAAFRYELQRMFGPEKAMGALLQRGHWSAGPRSEFFRDIGLSAFLPLGWKFP
jgi:hypothetical protein